MNTCVSCGHELGVGRFCTNCGHPIGQPASQPIDQPIDDGRTGTAERPAVPPPARFPLFADETERPATASYAAPGAASGHRRPGPSWAVWALLALALVAVAGLGIWLLSDGDPAPTTREEPRHSASSAGSSSASASPEDQPSSSTDPSDVIGGATVEAPDTAPPGQDVSGNPVDYEAANMLDGVPETTWRMPGDGTGAELVVTLAGETRLRSVGLINGYAKTARDAQGRELDWYHGNRRVLRAEWVFDDGTTITQELTDTTAVQSVDVDVTTTTVTLRLVQVSAPGTGRAARDYTAISDLSLVGAP